MNRKALIIFSLIYLLGSVSVFGQTISEPNPPDPNKTTIRGNAPLPPKQVPSIPLNEVNAEGFFGTLNENVYENEFFNFQLTFPEDYTVLNRAELELYTNAGKDMVKSKSDKGIKAFDNAIAGTSVLLGLAQKPPGTPENGVMELGTMRQAKGITANMVLSASVRILTGTGNYSLERTLPSFEADGRKFVGAEVKTDVYGVALTQHLFIVMERDYSLLFTISFFTEASEKELHGILKSISFTKK